MAWHFDSDNDPMNFSCLTNSGRCRFREWQWWAAHHHRIDDFRDRGAGRLTLGNRLKL